MKILDANMILRFLIRDNEEMAEQVADILKSSKVIIYPEITAEVVYVMDKVYHYDRVLTSNAVKRFLMLSSVVAERAIVQKKALQYYAESSLDFADCLLCACHTELGYEVCTFDKKLIKMMNRMDSDKK